MIMRNNSSSEIRKCLYADQVKLEEIFKLNVPEAFHESELKEFLSYLEKKRETYLVVANQNEVLGGVGYDIEQRDNSGRINWILFHPAHRHKGLGQSAVRHCLDILRSSPDVKKLVVRTSQVAYRFFEKFGFRTVFREKEYWAPGFDLYQMEMGI
jgi:ribosomal protein S18 acetylase RimI-like enzyme